jgi:thiol-disulfide isomerase/thioredoxin
MMQTGNHSVCATFVQKMVLFSALALSSSVQTAKAQVATNFTIVNHATGQPLSLYDYQGSVILLDFWAYWCGPCQEAAADIEPNLTHYYRAAGGNQYGTPVQVISISIDESDPAAEDTYIQTYGLELVGDDATGAAFTPFDHGFIPEFVVINGLTNSPNYEPWEVLYSTYGYLTNSTVPVLRGFINTVQPPPPGSLQVTITPAAAVSAGAQWQVDDGPPNISGTTVSNLYVGNHTVSFITISNWAKPASQTAVISSSQITAISANYLPAGSLQVTIGPAGAVSAGAQWQVDSNAFQSSGATVSNLAVGNHTVSFSTVAGWTTPANQMVSISSNSTSISSGTYVQQFGSLEVTISPMSAIIAGAQWRVDGGPFLDGGATATNLAVGEHTVSFNPISDWTAPSNQMVAISDGVTNMAAGTYLLIREGKPILSITSPISKHSVSNEPLTFTATVVDDVAVASLSYQLNGGSWAAASYLSLSNKWTAAVTPSPGQNAINAYAVDVSGRFSLTNTVVFNFISRATLKVLTNGFGTVAHDYNGQMLVIGRSLSMTASPGKNWLFSNWVASGSENFVSNNPTLKFVMQSNLVLEANFAPNLFIPQQGTFNGLFMDSNDVTEADSGFFTLALTTSGAFTGKIMTSGGVYNLPTTKKFNVGGQVEFTIPTKQNTLAFNLQLDISNPPSQQITGTVSDGVWTAGLTADRAVFSANANKAVNYEGKYTLAVSASDDASASPGGIGCATLSINSAGLIAMSGNLGDGQAMSQSVSVSKDGLWPFYAAYPLPPAGNGGTVVSWITFSNQPATALGGTMYWFRPAGKTPAVYQSGFSNTVPVIGSAYNPAGKPLLALTNAQVILDAGNLSSPITNQIALTPTGTLTVPNIAVNTNRLTLAINKTTGAVSGSFLNPSNSKKTIKVNGVLLQNQTNAAGYFLGTNQSGPFLLDNP